MANPQIEEFLKANLLKAEATYGVNPALTFANAFQFNEITNHTPEVTMINQKGVRSTFTSFGQKVGSIKAPFEASVAVAGEGNASDGMAQPPVVIPLLACGMKVTPSIASGVANDTYLMEFTSNESVDSLTLEMHRLVKESLDAKKQEIRGMRGAWTFEAGLNAVALFMFSFIGLFTKEVAYTITGGDLAALVYAGDAECDAAPTSSQITITYDGVSLDCKTVKITTNRKVQEHESSTAGENGYSNFSIGADADADFVVEVDPQETTAAVFDAWTKLLDGSTAALVVQLVTTSGMRLTFNAPAARIASIGHEGDNGIYRLPLTFNLLDCDGVTDNALSFTFDKNP